MANAAALKRPSPVSALLLRLTFVALGFAFALAPAAAADAPRYCRSVAAKLKADSDLAAAARAAFGAPQATDDEACLYPLQLLRYADVDVLVSQTGEPGEACHGCEASLSATVLKRVPGGAKRLRAFASFAKGGSSGAVASVTPIAIGGDDGIAIESGGTFQGYTSFGARPLRLPPTAVSSISTPARRCSSQATTAAPRPTRARRSKSKARGRSPAAS